MSIALILTIVLAFVFLLLLVYFLSMYNNLVALRNRVKNQRSQIDIELKRRFDLVPNLVETVKGYAAHETATLEAVMNARNSYMSAGNNTAQALQADGSLAGALSKLFALSESYPELKANAGFATFQKQLSEIEQKIVYSRQFYNDAVNMLNNKIETFPSSIVASMFGFDTEEFFQAAAEERENVKVDVNI